MADRPRLVKDGPSCRTANVRDQYKRTHKIGSGLDGIRHAAGRLARKRTALSGADATHIGASDPHAIEQAARLVPANVRTDRPAAKDSTVRYAGMYFVEPKDHVTAEPIEVFGRTFRTGNSAGSLYIRLRPVADILDSDKTGS